LPDNLRGSSPSPPLEERAGERRPFQTNSIIEWQWITLSTRGLGLFTVKLSEGREKGSNQRPSSLPALPQILASQQTVFPEALGAAKPKA
jgi:hypothetical protein